MPTWFKKLSLGFWRNLILSALAGVDASYDPAALDKIIIGQ